MAHGGPHGRVEWPNRAVVVHLSPIERRVKPDRDRMIAPLPNLIASRVWTGTYYQLWNWFIIDDAVALLFECKAPANVHDRL